MGAHPVIAAVVLFPLFVPPLPEHGLDLQGGQGLVQLGLLLVVLPQGGVGAVQPAEHLVGHLLLKGNALKIVQKGPVKGVEVGLALHQQTPAQVVKAGEAGLVEPLVQGLHQGHPLGEGYLQAVPAQQV